MSKGSCENTENRNAFQRRNARKQRKQNAENAEKRKGSHCLRFVNVTSRLKHTLASGVTREMFPPQHAFSASLRESSSPVSAVIRRYPFSRSRVSIRELLPVAIWKSGRIYRTLSSEKGNRNDRVAAELMQYADQPFGPH